MPWEVDQYATLINSILHKGEKRTTRNGDVYSVFGEYLEIDMSVEFPLLRGRKMFYKPVLGELAAMFRGPKCVDDFKKFGCNYWDSWGKKGEFYPEADDIGSLELDYGNAWINFNGVNQLETLVYKLKTNPMDRRLIVSGWRPDRLEKLSLPCCHMLYQWYVRDGNVLDMIWYQRSCDTMVGLPSDIVLCAAWNAILANQVDMRPGIIKLVLGDTHIYANHVEATLDYLKQLNKVHPQQWKPLQYDVSPKTAGMSGFLPEMFSVEGYDPMPAIKFTLNV